MVKKPPRSSFVPRTPARKGRGKAKSPLRHRGTKSSVLKSSRRQGFATLVTQLMREGMEKADAVAEAGSRLSVRKRDRTKWMARLEEAAGVGSIDDPSLIDPRALIGNAEGQGRPSAWDAGSRARLVKYLTTLPKTGSGVAQYPSTHQLADSEKLRKKHKLPESMPSRLAAVIARQGDYLLSGVDY